MPPTSRGDADPARGRRLGRQVGVGGVGDLLEHEAVGRHDLDPGIANAA
jgi:hypothetical protein